MERLGEEYPKDYYLPIETEPWLEGKVSVNTRVQDERLSFFVEITVVQKEGRKIRAHVGVFYGYEDEQDALDSGVQKLSRFLRGKR